MERGALHGWEPQSLSGSPLPALGRGNPPPAPPTRPHRKWEHDLNGYLILLDKQPFQTPFQALYPELTLHCVVTIGDK